MKKCIECDELKPLSNYRSLFKRPYTLISKVCNTCIQKEQYIPLKVAFDKRSTLVELLNKEGG